jgi:NAD(P)-dependent dehydrogenase (short-subunit alcohol dehydrogenase family)
MTRLQGQRILITGASTGVGLAAVERFAREGADLALIARGETALAQAAAVAREHGVAAHVLPADVADREAATAAVEAACDALGGLDAVVSNAGAVPSATSWRWRPRTSTVRSPSPSRARST